MHRIDPLARPRPTYLQAAADTKATVLAGGKDRPEAVPGAQAWVARADRADS